MSFDIQPAGNAGSFQISTPNLLSMVPLGPSLEILQRATISKVRSVSLMLTDLFIRRAKEALPEIEIVTPSEPDQRGGQVTLRHAEGRRIWTALRLRHRIIGDFRAPDLLRLHSTTQPAKWIRRLRHYARPWTGVNTWKSARLKNLLPDQR